MNYKEKIEKLETMKQKYIVIRNFILDNREILTKEEV